MTAASYVLRFDDHGADAHESVGGKGANLGLLARSGFPVPPGFTVTTAAYAAFLQTGGLGDEMAGRIGALDYESADALERVTAEVRDMVTGRAMAPQIADQITAAYAQLGAGTYVAVRSSGTAEDLADASFAGMHDTYLDISGADAVVHAVQRCWASLWTARAASYRSTRGFDHTHGIAVVVQTMVPAEVSGVMFTANPMTAATDEIVINSSWGLGEAIVSGIATPDEYVVAHSDLRVKDRRVGDKEQRVVRDPQTGVGTVTEDVPADERAELTLSDEQASQLAELGRRVQQHYGDVPQDIEWGCAEGHFHLLQSRPVTGVELSWDADVDDWQWLAEPGEDEVWTRAWSDNIWTGAITPLMYSFRARSFTTSSEWAQRLYGHEDTASLRMWRYHKAGAYYNCRLEKQFVSRTSFPATRPAMLENIPPAWHEEVLSAPFSLTGYVKMHAKIQFVDRMSGVATWRKAHDKYLEDGIERADGLTDEQLRRLDDKALERYIEETWRYETDYIREIWTAFFVHARDSFMALAQIVARWYDGPRTTAFTDLITGVPRPTAAMVETAELWRLAQRIRKSEVLSAAFEATRDGAFFEAAGDSEEGRAWLEEHAAFMAENGHRGHADRDVYYLRRSEDPGVDYRALASFMSADDDADPTAKEAGVEAKRQEVIEEVAENIRKKSFGAVRAELFKATLDYVMTFLLFRDDERHWVDRTTFSIKRGYKEISRRLMERGILEGEQDYFFLTGQELYAALHGNVNIPLARAKIAARRRNFDRIDSGAATNPMYIVGGRDADLEYDRVPGEELPDGMFRGMGTSGGVVEGTARVVKELTDIGRVRNGEILITNSTDPGWTPVFLIITGIVLETGGLLAHGSCLAREYGMPAVQLSRAMQSIPDGARIRLNGDAGTIEVLEAPEAAEPAEALVTA